MRIALPLIALPLALAACQGSDDGANIADTDSDAANLVAPINITAIAAGATPTPTADPIRLSQDDSVLDFDYTVPAEAAAIPALRQRLLDRAKSDKTEMTKDHAHYASEMRKGGFPVHPYGLTTTWKTVAQTNRFLVLVAEGYRYMGGAHGGDFYEPLVWDKTKDSRVSFGDLFTDKDKALATIRQPFCDTLNRERAKRRGGEGIGSGWETECPPFDKMITLAPARTVGGKFARIGVWIPADVAGSHAEGSYSFDLVIPKAMAALVKDDYAASFPGTID
ncbi:DUF4163 domain-containing protein [Stakelama sp. CBK3Z-3]|uniref:DUF4163 domain-containing protein n=1 Tax=Stakelama flava TaxID=2860338 RepID=A0ABS6XK07_9SPHN|nr:DUF4163 domain-containing protein [Stakelama flava]MBW4330148.1 DUF4163 domain-containing protein [Stakelama flava]